VPGVPKTMIGGAETADRSEGQSVGAIKAVVMYCTAFCPYCRMADSLLAKKGVTEVQRIRVDREPALRQEMIQRTGRRTVPQIYIGEFHVGGYDDLAQLERAGELESLLWDGKDQPGED
jgi:glutaredoxin 3